MHYSNYYCILLIGYCSIDDEFDPEDYITSGGDAVSEPVEGLNPNTSYTVRMIRIEDGGCVRRVSSDVDFETLSKTYYYSSTPTNHVYPFLVPILFEFFIL